MPWWIMSHVTIFNLTRNILRDPTVLFAGVACWSCIAIVQWSRLGPEGCACAPLDGRSFGDRVQLSCSPNASRARSKEPKKKKNKLWQIIIDNYSVLTDLKEGEFYHYFIIKSDNFPRLAAKLWFPCCLGRFSLWPLPPLGEEPSQWRLVMHCEGLGIQFPTACIPKAMTFR